MPAEKLTQTGQSIVCDLSLDIRASVMWERLVIWAENQLKLTETCEFEKQN